jgi:hypothetical protein
MTCLSVSFSRAYRIAALPAGLVRDDDGRSPRARASAWRSAIHADVVRPLVADRAEAYLTILAALDEAREDGREAAALDELRRRARVLDEDEPAFLRDLLQLEAWGCITRALEPARVRGYRDARRDRFLHRIDDDALALLAWLDERHARRRTGAVGDAGERFVDLAERLAELARLATAGTEPEVARRARHLVGVVDDELEGIERSLARLDGDLRGFSERGFDPAALERVVTGLERFLRDHVASLEVGRATLEERLAALDAAGFAARWATWCEADAMASLVLGVGARRPDGHAVIARWHEAFRTDGGLDRRARRVEQSTHRVIATLRAHVHAASVRGGARGAARDPVLRWLVERGDHEAPLRLWGQGPPCWPPGPGERVVPPLPRRRTRTAVHEPAPLAPAGVRADGANRPAHEGRQRDTHAWLERAGVAEEGRWLSQLPRDALRAPEAVHAWMAIARARHLGRGRSLARLGVRVDGPPGRTERLVTLGDDTTGLVAHDCMVARKGDAR